ncbi:MAG: metalloregulator ArsR/SmtB family transcription factor, partial [Mobilicoccus sp.]|nr:metalloregulator ArsR/SmtB family transcription factor [Mobilicoccus sp.]
MDRDGATNRWESAGSLFKTLSSPLRLRMVLALVERPHTVTDLVDHLGVSQPLVSQHLRVLREHCLVASTRHGREVTYSLMDEHVAHIVQDALAH